MPLPKGAKVLGQKREGSHLVLYYRDKGKVKRDVRKGCRPVKGTKRFHCK